MKVLVLGRQGQLAQALSGCDGARQHQIVLAGRPDVDVTQPDTLKAAIETVAPDVVVNASAYTNVDQAEREPELAFAVNAEGAEHAARVCQRTGCPLIHISTDYVFDGSQPTPYQETDPAAPLGVYGESKYAGEQSVADALDHHIILRTAWLHSPYGKNFVKTMLRLAADRESVSVVQDQTGSPTFAPHLADVVLGVAESVQRDPATAPWGTYHAAGQGAASWFDVAQQIFDQSKKLGGVTADVQPLSTAEYPTPARRPANSQLNCQHLAHCFAITLPDWRDGVNTCVHHLVTRNLETNQTPSGRSG